MSKIKESLVKLSVGICVSQLIIVYFTYITGLCKNINQIRKHYGNTVLSLSV